MEKQDEPAVDRSWDDIIPQEDLSMVTTLALFGVKEGIEDPSEYGLIQTWIVVLNYLSSLFFKVFVWQYNLEVDLPMSVMASELILFNETFNILVVKLIHDYGYMQKISFKRILHIFAYSRIVLGVLFVVVLGYARFFNKNPTRTCTNSNYMCSTYDTFWFIFFSLILTLSSGKYTHYRLYELFTSNRFNVKKEEYF